MSVIKITLKNEITVVVYRDETESDAGSYFLAGLNAAKHGIIQLKDTSCNKFIWIAIDAIAVVRIGDASA